jgi:hypothetical protein
MTRSGLLLGAALALTAMAAGCVANQQWTKAGEQTGLDADMAKCKYEAEKTTATMGHWLVSVRGIEGSIKQDELTASCMRAKGWTQ